MSFIPSRNHLWEWVKGVDGQGRVRIQFPFELAWYREQPCTQFRSLEHREEAGAYSIRHEFVALNMMDGSICRVERMGDPHTRLEALSQHGSPAHDVAQFYRPKAKSEAKLDTSRLIAKITFPKNLDLMDVLLICRAIQEGDKTRNYTLRTFNCYFFSLAIQMCLCRLCVDWEDTVSRDEWYSKLSSAITALPDALQPNRTPLLLQAFSAFNKGEKRTKKKFLDGVQRKLRVEVGSRFEIFHNQLNCNLLDGVLWYSSLPTIPIWFLKKKTQQVINDILQTKISNAKSSRHNPKLSESQRQLNNQLIEALAKLVSLAEVEHGIEHCLNTIDVCSHARQNPTPRRSKSRVGHPLNVPPLMDFRSTVEFRQEFTFAQYVVGFWVQIMTVLVARLTFSGILNIIVLQPPSKPRLMIDERLSQIIQQKEPLGSVASNQGVDPRLQQIEDLIHDELAVWNKPPWDDITQVIQDKLPEWTLKPNQQTFQVRFNESITRSESLSIVEIQEHILDRIKFHAGLVENIGGDSAHMTKSEIQLEMSKVWTLIRDNDVSVKPVSPVNDADGHHLSSFGKEWETEKWYADLIKFADKMPQRGRVAWEKILDRGDSRSGKSRRMRWKEFDKVGSLGYTQLLVVFEVDPNPGDLVVGIKKFRISGREWAWQRISIPAISPWAEFSFYLLSETVTIRFPGRLPR
ncbi:unnamed protein product [Rhizoctonia solani]|uniref:Uncharacterized protein n=1 Tax=Rhizoctonia solani TaxID=456999 RepID=A0A8H3ARL3_9AGAM|nr:unnamed protein product [Rhizoctonia solani]